MAAPAPQLFVVDADTLAGWRRSSPSLTQLWEAIDDLRAAAPDLTVAVIADASLKWALGPAERERIEDDVATGRLVFAPAGCVGGHIGFLSAVVRRADELKIRTLVLTDARVPGARLTRVRREGEQWVFDLKGSKPVEADASGADAPGPRRRRGRSAA
jgi:hypothetical protein